MALSSCHLSMMQVFAILPGRSSLRLCDSGDHPQVAGVFFVWSRAMVAVSKIAVFDLEGPWPAPPAAVARFFGFRALWISAPKPSIAANSPARPGGFSGRKRHERHQGGEK